VLYASRVSLPICAVAMAKEYGWTITDSVRKIFSFGDLAFFDSILLFFIGHYPLLLLLGLCSDTGCCRKYCRLNFRKIF